MALQRNDRRKADHAVKNRPVHLPNVKILMQLLQMSRKQKNHCSRLDSNKGSFRAVVKGRL
jgi:hypothetical protein